MSLWQNQTLERNAIAVLLEFIRTVVSKGPVAIPELMLMRDYAVCFSNGFVHRPIRAAATITSPDPAPAAVQQAAPLSVRCRLLPMGWDKRSREPRVLQWAGGAA